MIQRNRLPRDWNPIWRRKHRILLPLLPLVEMRKVVNKQSQATKPQWHLGLDSLDSPTWEKHDPAHATLRSHISVHIRILPFPFTPLLPNLYFVFSVQKWPLFLPAPNSASILHAL